MNDFQAEAPRLPVNGREAQRVFQRWDSLNGRYYFIADLVLEDGSLVPDVTFDGDTNVAVGVAGEWLHQRQDLPGRAVSVWLVVRDCTADRRFGEATAQERRAFRSAGS